MTSISEAIKKAVEVKENLRVRKTQDAIDSWADDEGEGTPLTTYTRKVSVSENTYNYVRDNPHMTRKGAVAALTHRGYKAASTTSLLSHMVRQGLLSQDSGGELVAVYSNYRPLKATPKKPEVDEIPLMPLRADVEGIAALQAPAMAVATASHITALLDNISVNEARALYVELHKLFGGK